MRRKESKATDKVNEIDKMLVRSWIRIEIKLTHQAILSYYKIWLN